MMLERLQRFTAAHEVAVAVRTVDP